MVEVNYFWFYCLVLVGVFLNLKCKFDIYKRFRILMLFFFYNLYFGLFFRGVIDYVRGMFLLSVFYDLRL